MASQCGTENLKKSGIHKITDLISFPWEKEPAPQISDEEAKELLEDMKNWETFQNEQKSSD